MLYTILIFVALFALVLVLVLFFLMQRRVVQSKNRFVSLAASKETIAGASAGSMMPGQASSSENIDQQLFFDGSRFDSLAEERATPRPGSTGVTGSIPKPSLTYNNTQIPSGPVAYPRPQQERHPLPSSSLSRAAHAQNRYDLEQEYERGMRTIYDEKIGAINFMGLHVVMNTPAEVELAFYVCKRQIRAVLQSRGLERAPTLTDIGGLVIGRDATAAWGQALKQYLEEMCIKVGEDTYLLAHYNSQANRPNQDLLQEKLRRIQFMTSAAINHFQSNIFDTREEAVAFLQRLREIYRR
ncbi:MAG TPA: hypothetical protein VFN35_21105 [Ktedonobacteraceae bacterium]|nr:hypothetical protein [Ktedonobacteraceae bacterium]